MPCSETLKNVFLYPRETPGQMPVLEAPLEHAFLEALFESYPCR